jgi:hypothetical protein
MLPAAPISMLPDAQRSSFAAVRVLFETTVDVLGKPLPQPLDCALK